MKTTPTPREGLRWLTAIALWANSTSGVALADKVIVNRVAGTGMALEATRLLGEDFSVIKPTVQWAILPSLGTPGGIRALMEGEVDIAVAARRPLENETARGVHEAACFQTALVFATSHPHPSGISTADLPDIFTSLDRKWPDGVPIKVILRVRSGSENNHLSKAITGLRPALEAASKRPGIPVGVTDQHNAELAVKTAGSFAVTTLLQVRSERLDLRLLRLDGNDPTVEALEDNSYPLPIPVCFLTMRNRSPAVSMFIDFLRSAAAQARLRSLGAVSSK